MTKQNAAVLVRLSIQGWGASKVDDEANGIVQRETGASRAAGTYSKRLIDKKNFAPINKIKSQIKAFHQHNTRYWDDSGQRMVKADNLHEYRRQIDALKAQYVQAAADLADNLPQYIEDARQSLGGLFDPNDYPTPEDIRNNLFRVDLDINPLPDAQWIPMSVQERDCLVRDIEDGIKSKWRAGTRELFFRLRTQLHQMRDRLGEYATRLDMETPNSRLHQSLLENILDLASIVQSLNIDNDPYLVLAVKKIEDEFSGLTIEELRSNAEACRKLQAAVVEIEKDIPHEEI